MEVLEHVMDVEQELDRFHRLLSPTGKLLVSVPVETGLPLVVKQVVRRIAGWRGLGDYPGSDPYTWGESLRSVFAGGRQHIVRPVHGDEGQARWHDHKGFNWMALRSRIARKFEIEETFSSPLRWLPPHLASQVWFVARKTQ
jgi:predicted SAM-dependent methyltransferase